MSLNINYIEYSIATKSLDIFFAGCNLRCKDCCNPELQDFNNGTNYEEWIPKISYYLNEYRTLITRIFLVGGSPNHQDSRDMETFLTRIKQISSIEIYLFAGEQLETIKPVFKQHCDYIKVGAYIPELKVDTNFVHGIKLATSNQKILKKGIDY